MAIDLLKLSNFDENLAKEFRYYPEIYIEIFERAVSEVYRNNFYDPMNENMEYSP